MDGTNHTVSKHIYIPLSLSYALSKEAKKRGTYVNGLVNEILTERIKEVGYDLDNAKVEIKLPELHVSVPERGEAEAILDGIQQGTKLFHGDPQKNETYIVLNKILARTVQRVKGKDWVQRLQLKNAVRDEKLDEKLVYEIIDAHAELGDLTTSLSGLHIKNRWWENNGS